MPSEIVRGHSVDLIQRFDREIDLIVTDPPYAFGGSGDEHEISAAVAVTLRECALRMKKDSWMIVFCASSWRSTTYMAEAVRGILTPVRIGTWCKPKARTKARTPGWSWASVNALALKKGKGGGEASNRLDHITCEPVKNGRRAEMPEEVCDWAVDPFIVEGGLFLDPFAGSGKLVQAASSKGMDAIGFEKQDS